MSQSVFTINPIFCMPIDLEDNNTKFQEEQKKGDNNSFQENDSFNSINECDDNNYKNIIVFSMDKNDKNIKSKTNSSKIYISEIFKRNWKLKSKRLITKLKKKLIKQIRNSNNEDNERINSNKKIILLIIY